MKVKSDVSDVSGRKLKIKKIKLKINFKKLIKNIFKKKKV